ncbi:MAG: NAD(+)/NADH kinase [Sandaracinaceae bacterium]|nr:NAD(+)/NADH kinase [Sandaracinaceae bacterium]
MSSGVAPRVLLVTRPTLLDGVIARHGTLGQARFFLKTRGQAVAPLEEAHEQQRVALATAKKSIPRSWRSARLDRAELSRFVFEPEDLIVAVGQDGLVANVAKYLSGTQRVIGVNPDPARYEGVLVPHAPEAVEDLLHDAVAGRARVESRTMVLAQTDDGQRLTALNEIYVGHRTHQSSRYVLRQGPREARHSSSGVIVCSGTGASGWARSIHRQSHIEWPLPTPTEARLAFLVREPWPSVSTSTDLSDGLLAADATLHVRSEMYEGGVLFGDGIEADAIELRFGAEVDLRCAEHRLHLVR